MSKFSSRASLCLENPSFGSYIFELITCYCRCLVKILELRYHFTRKLRRLSSTLDGALLNVITPVLPFLYWPCLVTFEYWYPDVCLAYFCLFGTLVMVNHWTVTNDFQIILTSTFIECVSAMNWVGLVPWPPSSNIFALSPIFCSQQRYSLEIINQIIVLIFLFILQF